MLWYFLEWSIVIAIYIINIIIVAIIVIVIVILDLSLSLQLSSLSLYTAVVVVTAFNCYRYHKTRGKNLYCVQYLKQWLHLLITLVKVRGCLVQPLIVHLSSCQNANA